MPERSHRRNHVLEISDLDDGAYLTDGCGGRGEGCDRDHGGPQKAAAVVNRASAAAPRYVQLGPSGVVEATAATERTDEILAAIAASAVELLGGPDRNRIRRCHAPRCGMFFVPGRERQEWCSPMCGNRARVARHYARHVRR